MWHMSDTWRGYSKRVATRLISCLFIVLSLASAAVNAQWTLRQSDDGHWITTSTAEGHQLIVAHKATEETHFLLILAVAKPAPAVPSQVLLTIDRGPPVQTQLKLLEQRPEDRLFRIELSNAQKAVFITRMIAGLNLRLGFGEQAMAENNLQFSLLGFTAAFNDLLIADRVGRLDPAWLIERNRERELGCYYTANLFVAAMQERIGGHSEAETLQSLPRSGHEAVDEMIPTIVSQVYAVPASQLPIEPRGDKFAIFEQCMNQ
jgi:hypothetical protein